MEGVPRKPVAEELARRHEAFVRAFDAGDADWIADRFYASDAVILPPNAPPVVGRAAIRAFLRAFHGGARRTGALIITRVEASGDLACVVGRYRVEGRFLDGRVLIDTGHLLEAWRRDEAGSGGAWPTCTAATARSRRTPRTDQPRCSIGGSAPWL